MQVFARHNSQSLWPDLVASLTRWRQWGYLAWVDIAARYRRSVIGPFWLTLTAGIFLTAVGSTFGFLWNSDIENFMPYFGVGYILWNCLSQLITESTEIYAEAAGYIQNFQAPKFFWILRAVTRNLIILAHMIPLYIVLALIFPIFTIAELPTVLLTFLLYVWHCLWISTILAALSMRYHDIKRLVPLVMSMVFLVTPILWNVATLQAHTWIYEFNPLYYIIEALRRPLLGQPLDALIIYANLGIAAAGTLFALLIHRVAVKRVFYWL